jgi:hypothetical protein
MAPATRVDVHYGRGAGYGYTSNAPTSHIGVSISIEAGGCNGY